MKHILFTIAGIFLPIVANAQDHDLNPLGTNDVSEIFARIIRAVLGFLGALALVFIIIGGFTILISRGNPEKIKSGKETIFWAAIGLIIAFSSWIILNFVITSFITQSV